VPLIQPPSLWPGSFPTDALQAPEWMHLIYLYTRSNLQQNILGTLQQQHIITQHLYQILQIMSLWAAEAAIQIRRSHYMDGSTAIHYIHEAGYSWNLSISLSAYRQDFSKRCQQNFMERSLPSKVVLCPILIFGPTSRNKLRKLLALSEYF